MATIKAIALVSPQAATAIGGISAALGNVGLVAAAAAAGYGIGKLINKMLGIDKGELGEWLYDVTHKSNGSSAFSDDWRNHIGQSSKPVQVTTHISVDGAKLAKVVTKHQAGSAGGAQTGITFADALLSLPSPANPF